MSPPPSRYSTFILQSFSRPRRPALIPSNCSLSAAETEDDVETRTQQLPFPNPDPRLLKDIGPASLVNTSDFPTSEAASFHKAPQFRETSPTSNCDRSIDTATLPPALARHPEQRDAWLKARAQYARSRDLNHFTFTRGRDDSAVDMTMNHQPCSKPVDLDGPKRKHSTFVYEQERNCKLEDLAGTSHISSLKADDDFSAQFKVEELNVSGEVAAADLEGRLMGESAVTELITKFPDEGSRDGDLDVAIEPLDLLYM